MAGRLLDKEFVLPFAFGTVAIPLGKKATDSASHRWTVYVRHPQDLDLTHVVQKIVFQLHPSFATPIRELHAPPYELTEHGWGEFEIAATVHFVPTAGEQPVELLHKLRLYGDAEAQAQSSKKPVVSETYDELVFSQPFEAFYRGVTAVQPGPAPPLSIADHLLTEAEDHVEEMEALRRRNAQLLATLQERASGLAY